MQKLRRIVDKAAPIVLLIYLLIGILAYVNIFPGSARFFYSSSTSGVIFRMISTALICVYSLGYAILHRNQLRFPWKWLILFAGVLFLNLFAVLFAKHDYSYVYKASLYGYLHSVHVTASSRSLTIMYLSSISDFALGFCFLFLLPNAFKRKPQLLWLIVPMVVFMLFECGYSVLKEYHEYIGIFSGEAEAYGGYNISIGATFGDKQEFGSFLTVGFCCAVLGAYIASTIRLKPWRLIARIVFLASATVFFAITFFTLCKTAILANGLALIVVFVALVVWLFKKHRGLGIALISIMGMAVVFVAVILTVDQLHSSGPFEKFYKLVNTLFFSRVNNGIFSRFYLVEAYFRKMSSLSFLVGFSKGGVSAYMKLATVESNNGLHTGFVYFQACYGLAGSLLYAPLLFIVVKNHFRILKKEMVLGAILIGCFICTVVFNLAECEVLIISGSAAIFMFNVINVVFATGYLKNEKVEA